MGETTIKNGMLYHVISKELYLQHVKEGWKESRIRRRYGFTKQEFEKWKENAFFKNPNVPRKPKKLTREKYIEHKLNGWKDVEIFKEYHMSSVSLRDWKKANFTDEEIKQYSLKRQALAKARQVKKEKVVEMATKTETKINTFEREYHEAIKEIESLREANKDLAKRMNDISEKAKYEDLYKKLEAEAHRLGDKVVSQDYEIENGKQQIEDLLSIVDELTKENNALKVLVKLWA